MPHSLTDEAIVLKAYNIGETDRFVVLLTRAHGRMTARVTGARKLLSNRGRGLLALHRISCTWQEHSFGSSITAAECLNAHHDTWRDPRAFSSAHQGIELLLALTEDGYPFPEIFDITSDFLVACTGTETVRVSMLYTLKLLQLTGYLPSAETAPLKTPPRVLRLIEQASTLPFSSAWRLCQIEGDVSVFLSSLLGSQLGISLKSLPVSLAMSSGVTPSCHVRGLAS